MNRYYFAWYGRRSVRVDRDGVAKSKYSCNGLKLGRWALVYGANARQARHYFIEGNVSKWFELATAYKGCTCGGRSKCLWCVDEISKGTPC